MKGIFKYLTHPVEKPNQPSSVIPPVFHTRVKQVWAIGGGKGGVGKSLIASSLAIILSRIGYRVIGIDFDLGGANLHTALGVDLPRQSLSDFINNRVENIQDCVVSSGIPRLELISGAQDSIGIADLNAEQKNNLLLKIRHLDADYLVLDLGAGTGTNTLDFFLTSDVGLVTMLPEPTSIENGYRFIKSVYFRYLMNSSALVDVRYLIESSMDPKNQLGIRSPSDLFREVNKVNAELGMKLKKVIEAFPLALIINQTRTQTDIEVGISVKTVCKRYFGINLDYIGNLDYDSAVWQAVRRKKPLILEFPDCQVVSNLEQIVKNILKRYAIEC